MKNQAVKTTIISIIASMALILGLMIGLPNYNVWSQEMNGRAELSRSEYSKKVKVEEAKANLESQKYNAQAEVERAKGAAQAIEIEAGKLTENYIRYLWVQQQSDLNDKTVIYIPTESGLPITEASRTSN